MMVTAMLDPCRSFCRVCQQQQKTLIFIGYSLMLQNVQFFICQARRENLIIHEDHADCNCYWRFNISHHALQPHGAHINNNTTSGTVQVHYHRIGTLSSVSKCPSAKIGKYKLHNESFTLGKWKDVKRLTKVLIEVILRITKCVLYMFVICDAYEIAK